MKITKQNILQALKEVKEEERKSNNRPIHHCDVCFVNYLLKIVTFDKGEFTSCMKVLNGVNKTFGTTYYIYAPLCEYGKAVPYEPLFKRLKRTVKI